MVEVQKEIFDESEGMTFSEIMTTWSKCRACEVPCKAMDGRSPIVADGTKDAEVIVVVDWPKPEDLAHRLPAAPVPGSDGVLIRQWVQFAIPETSILWTPAIGCTVPGQYKKYYIRVADAYLDACRPRLDVLIATVDPVMVLLIGLTAARALLGIVGKGTIASYTKQEHFYHSRNTLVLRDPNELHHVQRQIEHKEFKVFYKDMVAEYNAAGKLYRNLKRNAR